MANSTPCRLLELPGELRKPHLSLRAGQRSASRRVTVRFWWSQVYSKPVASYARESESIHLAENIFRVHMIDYNSDFMIPLQKKSMHVLKKEMGITIAMPTTQTPNWPNFLVWLKRIHGKEIDYAYPAASSQDHVGVAVIEHQLLSTLCQFAGANDGRKWEDIEELIERLHLSLKTANPLWT